LALSLVIIAWFPAWTQEMDDLIVLSNDDTLRCKVWSWENGSLFSKPNVTVDTGDGRSMTYHIRDIIAFTKVDSVFWSIPFRPGKKGNSKMVWAQVIMKNDDQYILKFENLIQSETGPHYELKYYHYNDRSFVEEVSNRNYRGIMEKHFSDCTYIQDLLAEKKNFFRNDRISNVADEYRVRCPEN
jgi:hypothetical protein